MKRHVFKYQTCCLSSSKAAGGKLPEVRKDPVSLALGTVLLWTHSYFEGCFFRSGSGWRQPWRCRRKRQRLMRWEAFSATESMRVTYVLLSYQKKSTPLENPTPHSREGHLHFSSLLDSLNGLVSGLTNWELDTQQSPFSITSCCVLYVQHVH